MTPFVSIIVPVRNGGAPFDGLLASLKSLDWPADRLEILIVDNGSTDDTVARARAAGLRVIEEPVRGASSARNRGAAESRGEILVFTDADCAVSRSWLHGITAPFADPRVGAAGGRTLTYPPKTAVERHAVRTRHLDAEHHLAHPTFPFASTANLAVRRSVFEAVGGFDPEFPVAGESVDFCTRLRRQTGHTLAWAPRGVAFHRARSTVAAFREQQRRDGHSLALLCARYRDEANWDARHDREADAEVFRAALLVAWGVVEQYLIRRDRYALETRWLEYVRLSARRRGFRQAVRERSLVFNRGAGR